MQDIERRLPTYFKRDDIRLEKVNACKVCCFSSLCGWSPSIRDSINSKHNQRLTNNCLLLDKTEW
jgi:hypothetical protein